MIPIRSQRNSNEQKGRADDNIVKLKGILSVFQNEEYKK